MTRLEGAMPYDKLLGASAELNLLLSEVRQAFMLRLQAAKNGPFFRSDIDAFAHHCVVTGSTCITFNYDDVFDEALWNKADGTSNPYWHPDGGYGFFCKPSSDCVQAYGGYKDRATLHLLKLHGSVNWRARLGWQKPYGVDAIVHHAKWFLDEGDYQGLTGFGASVEDIESHLESEPFVVPPVLVKASLVEEPLLQRVWAIAYKALQEADEVDFLGYSLPITDIAARTLFSEAIASGTRITIINRPSNKWEKDRVRDSYRQLFPRISEKNFEWRDARAWCSDVAGFALTSAMTRGGSSL
jgi:hypothetical protein